MRRPAPLPPPATPEPRPADREARPGDDEAPRAPGADGRAVPASAGAASEGTAAGSAATESPDAREGAAARDATVTADLGDAVAPVVPLAAPGLREEPAAEPVRLRDVWSAARARRKALRAEVRRFTGRQRRRRIRWIVAGASVVALVLITLAAAYSPLFAVRDIRVVGVEQLDEAAVRASLAGQLGTPLALVDDSAVKAALVTFPLVESYTLEAHPPHELVVRIVERTPIGAVETRAGYTLVDAAGVVLATTPSPPERSALLDVRGGTDSVAFEAVGLVMRSLPEEIRAQVTGVTATTADDVTLRLGATDTDVVWGSAEESALKALVLETMMAERPPDGVRLFDVSSPQAVVVG